MLVSYLGVWVERRGQMFWQRIGILVGILYHFMRNILYVFFYVQMDALIGGLI